MGRIGKIDALPMAVRQELMGRIVSAGYGDYQSITQWLKEQGVTVSKSTLHRFGHRLKAKRTDIHLAELQHAGSAPDRLTDLRMQCIAAAAAAGKSDVLSTAQRYLDWVLGQATAVAQAENVLQTPSHNLL